MGALMVYLSVDVSEFQSVVDDSYPHPWLSFRAFDGEHLDKNYKANLAWALKARASGKLAGFTVYFVWEPGDNPLPRLDDLGVPKDCTVMIDVESWSGRIKGDHSTELNRIVGQLSDRQGSPSRVWGYANRGDFAALWPTRPAWLGLVVASYGGDRPVMTGLVGWQYTNGIYNVHGKPSTTAPFGACDHNELYITESTESAGAVPIHLPAHALPEDEDDMKRIALIRCQHVVYISDLMWVRKVGDDRSTADRVRIADMQRTIKARGGDDTIYDVGLPSLFGKLI